VFVPKRDINHSVVDEGRKGVGDGDFLPTTLGAGGDKHTAHLASKSRLAPERACRVPESLPLHREVTIAGGNAEEEGIIIDEVVRKKDWIVWARGRPDELQNVLRQGLLDLVYCRATTGVADTSFDSLSEFGNMPVEGVDDNGNARVRHGSSRMLRSDRV